MKNNCKKSEIRNDIVKGLNTIIQDNKICVSLKTTGLGYDGCGTHTHGYSSSDKIQ